MPGVEPDPPRCKRGALPGELHPRVDADGWSRTTTARGDGVTGRWARQCPASAGRSGGRPDLNRRRGDHDPECCRLHHGHSGDGRTRTGGISPDKRAPYATELRPHGRSRGRDSNPRSRAHEAREDNRSSTAQGLAGRIRTCDPRLPGPVGWPAPPQPDGDRHDAVGDRRHGAGGRTGSTSSPSPSRDRMPPLPRGRPARIRRP